MTLPLWSRIGGPLLVLGIAFLIEASSQFGFKIPNPPALLLLAVVYAAFAGGYRPGFISAALAWIYIAWFFSLPAQPFHYTHENLLRVAVWAISIPLMVWMVSLLKHRMIALEQFRDVEEKLKKNEERLRTIIQTEPECIKIVAPDGNLIEMNAAGLAMLEAESLAQAQCQPLFVYIAPHHRAAFEDLHRRVMQGNSGILEFEAIGLKGTHRWLETHAVPLRTTTGEIYALLGITRDITGRKQAEKTLKKSEQSYATLVKNISGAVYLCRNDPDWTIEFISDGCIDITGYQSSEFLMNRIISLGKIMHPDDAQLIWEKCQANLATHKACSNEYRIIHRNGEIRWIWDQAQGIYSDTGELLYIEGLITDITGRKHAEKSLLLFQSLVNQSNDAIEVIDPDTGRFLDVNEKGCLDLGYSREEFLTLSVFDIDPMVDQSIYTRSVDGLRKTGTLMWEGIHRRKDGSTFPVEVNIKYVQLDRDYMVTVVRDITERKRAEDELFQSQLKLNSIIHSVDGIFWEADTQTFQFTFVSDQAERMLGYPVARWLEEPAFWTDHIHPEDRDAAIECCRTATAKLEAHDFEYRMLTADSRTVWLKDIVTVIAEGGRPAKLCGIIVDITERKRVEDAVRVSEQRLRSILDTMFVFVGLMTLDGQIVEVNNAPLKAAGLKREDVLGRTVAETYWFSYSLAMQEQVRQALSRAAQGEIVREDYSIRIAGGRNITIDTTFAPLRDVSGRVAQLVGSAVDITERKQAEDALRESEERLRLALDAAHMGSFDWDVPHNRITWSRWHEELWGFASGEFGGTYEAFSQRVHPDDLPGINAEVARCIATREPFSREFRVVWPDGSVHWVTARGEFTFGEDGEPVRMRGAVVETTERKRAEQKLTETEAHFHQLVNSSPSVIYATTLEGRKCIYVSETLTRMTGYEPQEMLTNSELWFSCVHPGDIKQTLSALESQMQQGEGTLEYRFRKKNGEYLWINDNFRFIRDTSGKPMELVGSWTDITASRHTEEQLAQAQKMEALGQLTGGIAHDFNNRLTVIMGNLELLQRTSGLNPAETDLIKTALLSADGAASLTRELLTFSRQQVLEFAVININELMTSMHKMLQRTLGEMINIVISPESDLWPVRTERHMLENVLINLAVNARDAMPKGGQLIFESHNVRLDKTFVANHAYVKPGDYVLLSVSDTGQGMSEEIKRRVFEPFFTTKEKGKGTGLGLAMVYGFVKQSGGHIEIYSEPEHGTNFKIYFPKDVSTAVVDTPSQPATVGEEEAVIRDKTILLVEDEATVRNIVVTLLGNLGCRVLSADSGPAALELFAKTPDIDLLFTDMIMPGGMTGLELAAKIRERVPELKVLYTSGYAPQAAADRRTIEHPNDFWLAKPYRFKTLKNTIIKVFRTQLT